MALYVDSNDRSLIITSRQQRQAICPAANIITPCSCTALAGSSSGSVDINCRPRQGVSITDAVVAKVMPNIPPGTIIQIFYFDSASISPQLTKIPPGLSNLTSIKQIYLQSNPITTIKSGDLGLNSPRLQRINLHSNSKLTTIEDNAFPGKQQINNLISQLTA